MRDSASARMSRASFRVELDDHPRLLLFRLSDDLIWILHGESDHENKLRIIADVENRLMTQIA